MTRCFPTWNLARFKESHSVSSSDNRNQLIRAATETCYLDHLQLKFDWADDVVDLIAWKSLSIALRRIHRECLCTKICNDLLPTASVQYHQKQQGHDTCSLCGKEETTEHMILCTHPSRLKLRRRYIKSIRTRLKHVHTKPGLIDAFCSAITDWYDYGVIDPASYHPQYQEAIIQQSDIGWNHVCMGHISTAWSTIQFPPGQSPDNAQTRNMWTSSIVEVSLRWIIDFLWETRNKDVHGHTETEQNDRLRVKHQATFCGMLAQKPHMRPSDHWLFPDNPEQFLATATAN